MQLQSLKTTIQGMMARAEQLRGLSERQTLYLHTCQVLTLLLEAPGEAQPGWARAALALLRPMAERHSGPMPSLTASRPLFPTPRSRPLVETIAPPPALTEFQECLQTVLELPDITNIASLEEILTCLEAAISVGAPRYNRGDIAGCARLYLATALTLVNAQVSRGFAGQARALDTLKKGLAEAQMLSDVDERAWTLRHAFDRVLRQ
jgi:hypothetical protein